MKVKRTDEEFEIELLGDDAIRSPQYAALLEQIRGELNDRLVDVAKETTDPWNSFLVFDYDTEKLEVALAKLRDADNIVGTRLALDEKTQDVVVFAGFRSFLNDAGMLSRFLPGKLVASYSGWDEMDQGLDLKMCFYKNGSPAKKVEDYLLDVEYNPEKNRVHFKISDQNGHEYRFTDRGIFKQNLEQIQKVSTSFEIMEKEKEEDVDYV